MTIIRTEITKDYGRVRAINRAAFEQRDDEADLVDRIRASSGFIPELSLVAEQGQSLVGHLLISKAFVHNAEQASEQEQVVEQAQEVLVLAPIAVHPSFQKQGIGTLLMHEGLARCRTMAFPLVLLIGHPAYYPRFGFRSARAYGLELKQFNVPDDVFMVYEAQLGALGRIKGELRYPAAFFGDAVATEAP